MSTDVQCINLQNGNTPNGVGTFWIEKGNIWDNGATTLHIDVWVDDIAVAQANVTNGYWHIGTFSPIYNNHSASSAIGIACGGTCGGTAIPGQTYTFHDSDYNVATNLALSNCKLC